MDFNDLDLGVPNPKVKEAIADSKNRPIVFFGAGLYFDSFDTLLAERGVSFAVADNSASKQGERLAGGTAIMSPREMSCKYKDSYACVSVNDHRWFDEISSQIIELGFPPDKLLRFREILLNIEYRHLARIYNMLRDDESREVFRAMLTFDSGEYIERFKRSNKGLFEQYFDMNILELCDDEVFVDIGAYVGDTADAFIRHTGGRFKAIHSFEPESENARQFLERHSSDSRITLRQIALGSKKTTACLSDNGSMSKLSNDGPKSICVERLDDVLGGESVSFIKMDIEGSELSALSGAEKTIRESKPKLAVCVYHKAVDIIQIAPFLKRCVPEYKLFLRHYKNTQCETVLYAVTE